MFPKGRKASTQKTSQSIMNSLCINHATKKKRKKKKRSEVVTCSKVALISQENVCAFEGAMEFLSPTTKLLAR